MITLISLISFWSMLHPSVAALIATAIVVLILGLAYSAMFVYMKNKLLRIMDACLGIEDHLGLDTSSMYDRVQASLKRAKEVR